MKKVVALFTSILLLMNSFTIPTFGASTAIIAVNTGNFDDANATYTNGTAPSGWTINNTTAVVDLTREYTYPKGIGGKTTTDRSMKLTNVDNGNWAKARSVSYSTAAVNLPDNTTLVMDMNIMINDYVTPSGHERKVFTRSNTGWAWGMCVYFNQDGSISVGAKKEQKLDLPNVKYDLNKWIRLTVSIDKNSDTYTYYINGNKICDKNNTDGTKTQNVTNFQDFGVDQGSASAESSMYLDDVQVYHVPTAEFKASVIGDKIMWQKIGTVASSLDGVTVDNDVYKIYNVPSSTKIASLASSLTVSDGGVVSHILSADKNTVYDVNNATVDATSGMLVAVTSPDGVSIKTYELSEIIKTEIASPTVGGFNGVYSNGTAPTETGDTNPKGTWSVGSGTTATNIMYEGGIGLKSQDDKSVKIAEDDTKRSIKYAVGTGAAKIPIGDGNTFVADVNFMVNPNNIRNFKAEGITGTASGWPSYKYGFKFEIANGAMRLNGKAAQDFTNTTADDPKAPAISAVANRWYRLTVAVEKGSPTYRFYLDGEYVGSRNSEGDVAIEYFQSLEFSVEKNLSKDSAYVDNMHIYTVPTMGFTTNGLGVGKLEAKYGQFSVDNKGGIIGNIEPDTTVKMLKDGLLFPKNDGIIGNVVNTKDGSVVGDNTPITAEMTLVATSKDGVLIRGFGLKMVSNEDLNLATKIFMDANSTFDATTSYTDGVLPSGWNTLRNTGNDEQKALDSGKNLITYMTDTQGLSGRQIAGRSAVINGYHGGTILEYTPTAVTLDSSQSLVYEMNVMFNDYSAERVIYSAMNSSYLRGFRLEFGKDGCLYVVSYQGSTSWQDEHKVVTKTNIVYDLKRWYRLTIVQTSNLTADVYVNGEKVGQCLPMSGGFSFNGLSISQLPSGSDTPSSLVVDDVGIYTISGQWIADRKTTGIDTIGDLTMTGKAFNMGENKLSLNYGDIKTNISETAQSKVLGLLKPGATTVTSLVDNTVINICDTLVVSSADKKTIEYYPFCIPNFYFTPVITKGGVAVDALTPGKIDILVKFNNRNSISTPAVAVATIRENGVLRGIATSTQCNAKMNEFVAIPSFSLDVPEKLAPGNTQILTVFLWKTLDSATPITAKFEK